MRIVHTLLLMLLAFCTPFLLVWIVYLITGLAIQEPKYTFNEEGFWVLSVFYWLFSLIIIPIVRHGDD